MSTEKILTVAALLLIAVFGGGYLVASLSFRAMADRMPAHDASDYMSAAEQRDEFLSLRDGIVSENMAHGDYACCLENPCTYCIAKTPGHGEGSTCTCLDDVMNGRHPCGECIGEILEGHGNRFLRDHFARAIAEDIGSEHLPTLEAIIAKKYPTEPPTPPGTCPEPASAAADCAENQ